MKNIRLLAIFMAVVVICANIFSIAPIKQVNAEEFGEFEYLDIVLGIKIVGFFPEDEVETVIIPDTINGKPVIQIGEGAFDDAGFVKKIVLPNTVKHLDGYAFSGCEGVTSLVIPEQVETISSSTFSGCDSLINYEVNANNPNFVSIDGVIYTKDLTKVIAYPYPNTRDAFNINAGTKEISSYAFEGAVNLKNIVLPEGVEIIRENAFLGCENLQFVNLPSTVISVSGDAFEACAISKITLSETNLQYTLVDEILYTSDKKTLVFCPQMLNITDYSILNETAIIGASAFSGNKFVQNINLTLNVKKIERYAFSDCVNLVKINGMDEVEIIEMAAFAGCEKLQMNSLPQKVSIIEDDLFAGCLSVNSFIISPNVTVVKASAFDGCTGLIEFIVQGNSNYEAVDGVLFTKDLSTIVKYPSGKTAETYNIPASVIQIEDSAFAGNESLKNIVIPSNVKHIGENLFEDCLALENVKIEEGVTALTSEMFVGCDNLKVVDIPSTVIDVPDDVFEDWEKVKFICPKDSVVVNVAIENGSAVQFDDGTYPNAYVTVIYGAREKTIKMGSKFKKPSDPKRKGYSFIGWYVDEEFKQKYDFKNVVEKDLEIFAKWIKSPAIPAKVKIKKLGLSKVKISWKKVKGQFYQVQMSNKKAKGYKTIRKYKKNIASFTKSGLKRRTTYYFKVTTYKIVDKVKCYSGNKIVKIIM